MKKIILLTVSFFTISIVQAQVADNYDLMLASGGVPFSSFYTYADKDKSSVDLSAFYIYPDWEEASIEMDNGKTFRLPARYNVYHNKLEIMINEKILVLSAANVKTVNFNKIQRFIKDVENSASFVESVHDGRYPLVKKYYVKKVKADYNPTLNVGSKVDTYEMKFSYYLITPTSSCEIKKGRDLEKCLKQEGHEVSTDNSVESWIDTLNSL